MLSIKMNVFKKVALESILLLFFLGCNLIFILIYMNVCYLSVFCKYKNKYKTIFNMYL